MATWGSQTWGFANWGTLGDATVEVSGHSLNSQLNSVTAFPSVGWGAQSYGSGEWGELASPEAPVTGIQSTTSLGTAQLIGESFVQVTSVTATSQTGQLSYEAKYQISGVELTTTLGNEFAGEAVDVPVTSPSNDEWGTESWGSGMWGVGDGITIFSGTLSATGEGSLTLTGVDETITIGTAVAGASALVLPSGVSASVSQGDEFAGELVEVPVTSPSNDEWGTDYWGAGMWGVGDGITLIPGTPTITGTASVQVTGISLTPSIGTVEIPVIIDTGIEITSSIGNAFGGPNIEIQVTTASAQPWGEVGWGDGQWGQSVGTDIGIGGEEVAVPSVEVDVTGIALNANIGSLSITGDANISLTGIALDIQLGDEDAFTNVRVGVSGLELGPIVIGDYLPGINADVTLTGVTATPNTGTIGLNAWAVVDPGTSPTWTVVDKAA